MTIDVFLTTLVAVFGVLLSGIGVEMAARSPEHVQKNKKIYRFLFVILGIAIWVTTTLQAVRSNTQQDRAKNEAHRDQLASHEELSYMKGKLDSISAFEAQYIAHPPSSGLSKAEVAHAVTVMLMAQNSKREAEDNRVQNERLRKETVAIAAELRKRADDYMPKMQEARKATLATPVGRATFDGTYFGGQFFSRYINMINIEIIPRAEKNRNEILQRQKQQPPFPSLAIQAKPSDKQTMDDVRKLADDLDRLAAAIPVF